MREPSPSASRRGRLHSSTRLAALLLALPLLAGCRVHAIEERPVERLTQTPLVDGRLLVLRFEDKTAGNFLDGFWLDSCADPVGELSQLYAKHLRATGLFKEVRYVNTTDREAALKQVGAAELILSGDVTQFTSQMHAYWIAYVLIPTSALVLIGAPTAPAWAACDVEARYTLSDAAGTQRITNMPLRDRGRQSLFFATWWTEGFVFNDTLQQAAHETAQALGAGVFQRLQAAATSSK